VRRREWWAVAVGSEIGELAFALVMPGSPITYSWRERPDAGRRL